MKMCSVKRLIGEVADTHTGFLVVELVHPHVLLLNLNSPVVERVAAVLTGGHGNHHFGRDDLPIDALDTLRRNSKNFAHNASD